MFSFGCQRLLMVVLWTLVTCQSKAHWWGYIAEPLIAAHEKGLDVNCEDLTGLSKNQMSLCRRYIDHMLFVGEGARTGISECQWQFRDQRWNCSTSTSPDMFKKSMKIGSKEAAFTYAVAASAVVHAIGRACRSGKLELCGCSMHDRPQGLRLEWEWGGCGDNTEHAYGFAREFLDAKELDSPLTDKNAISRKLMNVHNNEVGRLTVVRSAHPACKCHGVSGSCSLKTCWMHVPEFRKIGNKLKLAYDNAVETKVSKRGQLKNRVTPKETPSISSMVFLESSPDYCSPNKKMGVLGTKGRVCKKDSTGEDGCGRVCCGRTYTTSTVEVVERCNCNFHWCCVVKCDTCRKTIEQHICT